MKFAHVAIVLSVVCTLAGFTATGATKSTGAKKVTSKKKAGATPKAAAKSTTAKKATGKPVASSGKSRLARGKSTKKAAPAATWRTRQQAPTPDRYKEIQQALIDKGYLKGEPTGIWDNASVDALSRFQVDQKMTPTGKINAPSLIGLGLGAKSAGAPEAAPLPPGAVPGAGAVEPAVVTPSAPAATQ